MDFKILSQISKIKEPLELTNLLGDDELVNMMIFNHSLMSDKMLNEIFKSQSAKNQLLMVKYSNKISDDNIEFLFNNTNKKKQKELFGYLIQIGKITENLINSIDCSNISTREDFFLIIECKKLNSEKINELYKFFITDNNMKKLNMAASERHSIDIKLLNLPNLPVNILEKLSKKNCNQTKKLVLHHKNTPSWLLQELKSSFPRLAENHQNGKCSVDALLDGIEHYRKIKTD